MQWQQPELLPIPSKARSLLLDTLPTSEFALTSRPPLRFPSLTLQLCRNARWVDQLVAWLLKLKTPVLALQFLPFIHLLLDASPQFLTFIAEVFLGMKGIDVSGGIMLRYGLEFKTFLKIFDVDSRWYCLLCRKCCAIETKVCVAINLFFAFTRVRVSSLDSRLFRRRWAWFIAGMPAPNPLACLYWQDLRWPYWRLGGLQRFRLVRVFGREVANWWSRRSGTKLLLQAM